jgi:hypothetical protein
MIEAAILLHQDDDMLDIADCTRPPVGRDGGGAGDRRGQGAGSGEGGTGGKE